MSDKNYYNKIAILFIASFANIFVLWYFIVREESFDWADAQVSHLTSPYAVSENSGGVTVSNIIMNYDFKLPAGFKTVGARNFNFFLEEGGGKKCEIKHYYLNADRVKELSSDDKREVILWNNMKLIFELVKAEEKKVCGKYLREMEKNMEFN